MAITVREARDAAEWNAVIDSTTAANFLQSYLWSEFHQQLGKKTWPLLIFDSERPIGVALTVKEVAKRGDYLTIAGGPVLIDGIEGTPQQTAYLEALVNYLRQLAEQESVVFVRVRPQLLDTPENRALYQRLGFSEAPMHLTADLTLQLDLQQSDDELLAQMRKNTRYEIRKAEREGITIRTSQDPAEIAEFDHHQQALAKKHGFVPFSYEFLHKQFSVFADQDAAMLFHAYRGETLLASAFIIFYNGEAVYHYGVSTAENQRQPGSYACQWAAIQEAKARDCHHYNFWGIAPKEDTEHRFAGVSLFKRGFGGEEVHYLPAHDLPISGWYTATNLFETVRAKARGL